jgi:protocatechuate 3,4-dioxygenase beta subunit
MSGMAAMLAAAPLRRAAGQAGACVLTPESGEGPFYFDPRLVRRDITEGSAGVPLELLLRIVRAPDCATLEGARVDLWHADAAGLYSGYARQPGVGEGAERASGRQYLRGTQFTAADGTVRFRTIYPSWYRGRTPHLHFKIFVQDREVVASQVFFEDEVNAEVFSTYEPYRRYVNERDTFNSNDSFLSGGTAGAFCSAQRAGDEYRAEAVIAIRPA